MELLYNPKYDKTATILSLVDKISKRVDVLTVQSGMEQNPKLRRNNRIKSIHSSLAIENNSLSLEQVTAILSGKRVLAPPQDIAEVQNAFEAYNKLLELSPYDIDDLLLAHQILMKDLVKTPGQFRTGNMGVVRGKEIVHVAPPADNVSGLMADLLLWLKESDEHPLIKSSVFHYEFEFVHPFADGNGRMGRMWQTLILYTWKEIFAWLPIESIIRETQQEYYKSLGAANDAQNSTVFVEFMLKSIWNTLEKYWATDQVTDQVKKLLEVLGDETLSATQIMEKLELKHRPTFRENYLTPAIKANLIEMTNPEKPNSRTQKYRKINN